MTFVGDSVKGEYSDVGLRDEVFFRRCCVRFFRSRNVSLTSWNLRASGCLGFWDKTTLDSCR